MNTSLLKARQTKYAAYAAVYILVVIALVSVGNVLADRYNKTYDATSNKRYSLSEQTAKIVKGLKQDVTITYYDETTRFQSAKDLLEQYSNLAPRIHVVYVDVVKQPMLAREAGVKNPGTALVRIGNRQEEAKSMSEEGITGAFIRDIKNNARTVCFITGSGEHQIDDSNRLGYSRFKDFLDKEEYIAKSISLLEKAEVPADCTVVVVGGPTGDYQQPEVDAIKKYVEAGGRALITLDPPLKLSHSAIADNTVLNDALQAWGVTFDKDLILDLNPIGQLAGLGPQEALVTSYDSHPIVNELKGSATAFPLSRSLTVKNGDKTTVEKLFSSSSTSLATTNLSSPAVNPDDPKNLKGPLLIAAAGTYNTGKENSQGRFMVIGSSTWLVNSFITFNGNSDLAMNTINWLASDEDLISIRPKEREDRRITMTASQLTLVQSTSIFLMPLLVIAAGVSVWWKRR